MLRSIPRVQGAPVIFARGATLVVGPGMATWLPDTSSAPVSPPSGMLRIPWGVAADRVGGRVASWWWLGVHGGCGVSTVAATVPGGADARRRWPEPGPKGPLPVVLVGRSTAAGLQRLRAAARQWAARDVPGGLRLAGAVVVAARPGKLPDFLADELGMLGGVVPAVWSVAWRPELLDVVDPVRLPVPPDLYPLEKALSQLRVFRP